MTGDYSSDDFMVKFAMANHSVIAERNKIKYDKTKEANRIAKADKERLREIAELTGQGYSQKYIADRLGVSQGTISRRLNTIRIEYPEFNELCTLCNLCTNDNVNDNDNDNDNVLVSSTKVDDWGGAPNPHQMEKEKEGFRF